MQLDKVIELMLKLRNGGDRETARRLLFLLRGIKEVTPQTLEAQALAASILGDKEEMDSVEASLNRICEKRDPACHLARALVERLIAEANINQAELALNHVEEGLRSVRRLLRSSDAPHDYLEATRESLGSLMNRLRIEEARLLLLRSMLLPEIGFDKVLDADADAQAAAEAFRALGLTEDAVRSELWRFRLGAVRGALSYESVEALLKEARGTGTYRLVAANYLAARAVGGMDADPGLVMEVRMEPKLSAPTLGLMAIFDAINEEEFKKELARYREEFMPRFVSPAINLLRGKLSAAEAMEQCSEASPDEETCREYVKQAEEGIIGEEQLLYVAFMQDSIGSLGFIMSECLGGELDMGREYILYWASPNTNSAIKWRLYSDLLEKAENGCSLDAKKAISKIFFYLI